MVRTVQMKIDGFYFDATTQIKYSKPKVNRVLVKNVNFKNVITNKSLYSTIPLMLTCFVNQDVQ